MPEGAVLRAGVCVVGGGAAGITLARELSSRHDVVLLESGDRDLRGPTQDLYEGSASGIPYDVRGSRLRYLGGSTNHWSGWCAPLDATDFEVRDWVPYSGWPIDRGDLDPYYPRAHDVCDLGPFDYDLDSWSGRLPGMEPLLDTPTFRTELLRIGPAARFGERYLPELASRPNVRVLLRANATNIRMDGRRVVGVDVATLAGNRFAVDAAVVVVAAGGIENARLLLASRDDRVAGIGNDHDLVGRFFVDHPHFLNAGRVALSQRAPTTALHTVRFLEPGLALDRAADGSVERWLLGTIALTPDASREMGVPRSSLVFNLLDRAPTRADRDVVDLLDAVDPVGEDEIGAGRDETSERWLKVEVRAEAFPNPDSRVTLTRRRDALGMPQVDLHWALTEPDWAVLDGSVALLGRELGRLGLGRAAPRPVDRAKLEGGSHHIGTTRMHHDPTQGVVDGNCRVHDVEGLYVAGSSVFTTAGTVNPTLSIVALTLRLADHLEQVA